MKINAIRAFSDNYIWIIEIDEEYVVVDPGEAEPVFEFLKDKAPAAILLTHKHSDHVGGVEEIVKKYGDVRVFGPNETAKYNDVSLSGGTELNLLGKVFAVMDTPGHTEEHISYLVEDKLFCGDALFLAGCGRVFTKDYVAQYETMKKFAELDDEVEAYPAHEYSLSNLEFTKKYRPNDSVEEEYERVKKLRDEDKNTLPTTIGKEKEINPFIRAKDLDEFVELRLAKDKF